MAIKNGAAPSLQDVESGKGYQGSGPCIVDGCTGWYDCNGKGGSGRGMCGKHYARWRRRGTAEAHTEVSMRGLADAALEWAANPVLASRTALEEASLVVHGTGAGARFTKPAHPILLGDLLTAAEVYADTDTEAEADPTFMRNRSALLKAAKAYAHARADYSLNPGLMKPGFDERRHG